MMAAGHATSGAAVWLSGCAVLDGLGHRPGFAALTVGTAVCAGWALAPDLDHPNSTVAHSAGQITRWAAQLVAGFGAHVHARTRTREDHADQDGHRTVTHTALWALLCGGIVALLQQWGGPWTAAVLVFIAAHLGIKAALPPRRRWFWMRTGMRWPRRVRVSVSVFSAVALSAVAYQMAPQSGWWLGIAVTTGSLVHCLGDSLTNSACPLLWPMPIGRAGRKRVWYPVGPPEKFRFSTGGVFERRVVRPMLAVVAGAALMLMLWPETELLFVSVSR